MGITDKYALNGKRLYSCDLAGCGSQDAPWGRGWIWYGSYRDIDDDPSSVLVFCSQDCLEAQRSWQALNGMNQLPPLDESDRPTGRGE